MPHGGYHGNVVIGGNVVQSGYQKPDGSYGISGGIDDESRLDLNPPSGNQNDQNINQQVEDKKKEIEALNLAQEGIFGTNVDPQVDVIDQGFFPNQALNFVDFMGAGIAPNTVFPATGATGDTAKGLATLQNIQNQQLNNLLQQQQEINLANQIKDSFAKYGTDRETADNLRKLFTGDLGDKTFLGMNLGSTETTDPDKTSGLGAATVINPYTGERITTGKIREGMTSPEYAEYMSDLYDLNPALMEQIFPFGSGQIAKPLFVKALDAVKGVGSGIAGLPGISELGQMVGNVGSAIVSPLSGLFTGQSTATPQTPGSTYEELLQQYGRPNLIPDNLLVPQGDTQAVDKFGNPVLSMGQYSSVPEEFMQGFMNSPFYKNVPGGAAITYVTLPDGRKIKFGDTGSASQFRQYLESIGAMQPESTEDFKQVKSQPTGLPAIADYASMAPQFTGSEYTNQGVSPAFLENLRRFYG
jgi:hypothetical protein